MFFIFGMPRSGTTLLAQCLNAHSNVVVPDETDFIIPMAFTLDRVDEEKIGRELVYKLISNSARFTNSIGEYLDSEEVHAIIFGCEYTSAAILDALYAAIAEKAGVRLAGDKSPNDLNFLRILVKTGGLASGKKIIHIVRDIRDVMVSVNRTGWVNDLDIYFPRFWSNQNLYLNALYGNETGRYALIRYEDLVTNPEEEIARLCDFLEIDFQPGMLLAENRDKRYEQNDAHTNLYMPISDASVGKYIDVIDTRTLKNYEEQAGEAMKIFGYQ